MKGYFKIRWEDCGIGAYTPMIWETLTGGPAVGFSPDKLELSLRTGESDSRTLILNNAGAGTLEYAAVEYEVPVKFHPDAFNAYEGKSWWCGDPDIGGYDDHWLQYLDTPLLDLSGTAHPMLTWMGFWAVENTGNTDPPWDGWDGVNVWVSSDGGGTFQVASPVTPPYTCQSLWSFGHQDQGWNFGTGIAGWGGESGGWTPATFDLTPYRSAGVIIRFALASDMAYCSADDPNLLGFFVDNIRVTDGSTVLFEDQGENGGTMNPSGFGMIQAEWMALDAPVGVIVSSGSAEIRIGIDASGIPAGDREGIVQISTNDSTMPVIEIPVLLHVGEGSPVHGTEDTRLPDGCALFQNYPNPFNAATLIPYTVSAACRVTLSVYDHLGRKVVALVSGLREPGYYQESWQGTDDAGRQVGSGLYFIRLQAGNSFKTLKVLLLR